MMSQLTRKATVGTALLLAVAAMTACTTVGVSSTRYLGVPQFAPTDPNTVEILRHEPRRNVIRLGEVFLEPSGHPSVAMMEQALRVEAGKLGANAAVLVYDKFKRVGTVVQGPWWSRSAYPVYGRRIVAVAIRYQEPGAEPRHRF
ncbi:MAG: hypothetical protein PHQ91_10390 [Thermoanaerobaculaceae bacterium]|nr:hypothetical protein [Thermoanaerobaculaceae bacterium]TAM46817.1 MAG: hypothetical protein EPN53_12785 [Acidobacteriota bacterium]